jgi:hypothetical protein
VSEKRPPRQDLDITDPVHWKGFLVVGLLGLVVSILVGGILGMGPADVILLKEPALAIFQIGDYVFIGFGLLQAIQYAFPFVFLTS